MEPAALVLAWHHQFEQQVGRADRAGSLLRPFEEHEPRTGEDVVEACIKPLLTGREPIQIKVIDGEVREIIGFDQGECRALDSARKTEFTQDRPCQRRLAGPKVTTQVHDK